MDTVCVGLRNAKTLDYVAAWYIKAARFITTAPDSFAGIVSASSRDRKQFADVQFGRTTKAVESSPNDFKKFNKKVAKNGIAIAETGYGDLFTHFDDAETLARRQVRCGFVSTNSIAQGEQASVLWAWCQQGHRQSPCGG